ncbi:MAG: diacylglycerol kinase family lipid kinase [Candidatus Mcinerneyibacterium aminivorans]|uniref:Diacylglycerol kinase family lipid kinase n=1 Tax=Candidatus Mcinerneyibacterium aminivorans TaxID=2703815 RepID=A0A5D0MHQ7_9BACT|nr:MAG: diacylglycerol kinase family lipid kinase [Candidatus Mcinerneyibacterium aminivorans]
MNKWLAIVNPHAGIEKTRKKWDYIEYLLTKNKIDFEYIFTTKRGDATGLAREAVKNNYKKIISVGGDGTANEVVNGIFKQKYRDPLEIILGVIEVGTGNDWCKSIGVPSDFKKSIALLKSENRLLHDVGLIKYRNNKRNKSRYFINVAGLGFDAAVAYKTNCLKDKSRGNKFSYFWNILSTLFKYEPKKVEVSVGEDKFKEYMLSMNVGIGKYSGGKMQFTPSARIDDGLFDFTFIENISKIEIIKNIKRLYDGTILEHPNIRSYRAKTIEIKSDERVFLEADGESLGHTPAKFTILKRALNVVSDFGR